MQKFELSDCLPSERSNKLLPSHVLHILKFFLIVRNLFQKKFKKKNPKEKKVNVSKTLTKMKH